MAHPVFPAPQRSSNKEFFLKNYRYKYTFSIELVLKLFTSGIKLLKDEKHNISEVPINDYAYQLNLTIRRLDKSDFGTYTCSAENAFGKMEGSIRLQGTVTVRRRCRKKIHKLNAKSITLLNSAESNYYLFCHFMVFIKCKNTIRTRAWRREQIVFHNLYFILYLYIFYV